MQLKTSKELKCLSREQLLGNYKEFVLGYLLIFLFSLIGSEIIASVSDYHSTIGLILMYLLNFLLSVFLSVFDVSTSRMHLALACGQKVKIKDIYYGFSNHLDKSLSVNFIKHFCIQICFLPSTIISFLSVATWIKYCLYLVCLIPAIYFALRFALVNYILLDFPNYSVKEIFQAGKYLMKNQTKRYLYICFSMIGLALISVLTFGIGYLWVNVYLQMIFANFYLNLIKTKAQHAS